MSKAPVISTAEFVTSAHSLEKCPAEVLPEAAFAGRSNVGKSSLINCLLARKKLVRTSNTPGRTQSLNFFRVNGAWFFVDLPGYGFAKVSESVRMQWGPMVEGYLSGRRHLRGVVHIMDLRHPPTAQDLELWGWFAGRGIPAVAVLTKADKLSRNDRAKNHIRAAAALGIAPETAVVFSAETREGRDELWARILPWFAA